MIKLMEKECIIVMTAMCILVFGEMINNKEKGIKNLKMDLSIKEHTKMEKRMDMVFTNGEMVANIKEISNKTHFMVKESIIGTLKNTMVNGSTP
jgi:hypothetical protein